MKALARRFVHLRDHGAEETDQIGTYWDNTGAKGHVRDEDVLDAVRVAMVQLNLAENGITPDRVGTHSLCAGGAMALKFAGADQDDIKKMGRLSLDTFLIYIHDQIAEYSEGWTGPMSQPRSYFNLEGAFQ